MQKMGKKKNNTSSLGRSLINDRFGKSTAKRTKDPTVLHSSEVPDGYDWGRLNLKSVTEESSFQEFLSTAQLTGTEFETEKMNITFVNPLVGKGLLSQVEKAKIDDAQMQNKHFLSIPRRPQWNENTTHEQLEENENREFLEWRRQLAILQEEKEVLLTPYEKNIEFWRQLWRVVERSDVVVQIVDARNPLLFRCQDLNNYVHEVSSSKLNLILMNKADFLTTTQRQIWADYFGKLGARVAFYSATQALDINKLEEEMEKVSTTDEKPQAPFQTSRSGSSCENKQSSNMLSSNELACESIPPSNVQAQEEDSEDKTVNKKCNIQTDVQKVKDDNNKQADSLEDQGNTCKEDVIECQFGNTVVENSAKLLTRSELIEFFNGMHEGPKVTPNVTTIGLVGYPNVGKSSTINSLLLEKKVSVSATPGKTKHFQTLFVNKDLLLCDCPGLVMPSFVYSKAEMVINGILPIDQMRDHVPPVTLVASLIPRHVLEDTYGIMLPPPDEGEDPSRPPTSEELLNAYGYNRGFMTQNGQPDNPRSSRHVLKDFVNGKLLYCHCPPGHAQDEFHNFPSRKRNLGNRSIPQPARPYKPLINDLDKTFFAKATPGVHVKGVRGLATFSQSGRSDGRQCSSEGVLSKPWKDHSYKRNKREKLRKVYAHLDH